MAPDGLLDLFREALFLVMLLVAIIIVPSLLVGLVVSMFQAATQINEQTMSFLPRLLVTVFTIMVAGPGMTKMVLEYTNKLIVSIPIVIG